MKTIYFAFIEDPEMEGMFSDKGEMIDFWYCSDAHWRDEYFNPFMKKMGIEVKYADGKLKKKCQAQLLEEAKAVG